MINDFKITADSSSDTLNIEGVQFAAVPLKIITEHKEFIDNQKLDVEAMANVLKKYNGKSSTACPSPIDWFEAFGDTKYIFCVTITSGLSGSYNSACIAKNEYETEFPDRKVFIIDSLSAGPELRLIIEKLRNMILNNKTFEEICEKIKAYQKQTSTLFVLESMRNLANNGRVSTLAARTAGLLGIRAIGTASDKGKLEMLSKVRGEKHAISAVYEYMQEQGYTGGKVRIGNCSNIEAATKLKNTIIQDFPNSDIEVYSCGGLCSFYAEKGGLIIGFEKLPII